MWTKTLDDVDIYFYPDHHVQSYSWRKFDKDTREAAYTQAQRELQVSLGITLADPDDDDVYNVFYAVCEQSLYILLNTPRQEEDGVSNVIDEGDEDKENKSAPTRQGVLICPQASRYLGLNRIKMSRG